MAGRNDQKRARKPKPAGRIAKAVVKNKLAGQAVKEAGMEGLPFARAVAKETGMVKRMQRRKGK
jgi:hypothetical protein